MKGAADAIAAGLTDAHMQRGATQMEPREVAANGEREREREKNSAITNRIEQREWTGEVEGIMEGCRE